MQPLIGITSGINNDNLVNVNKNYCLAVSEAGGIPLVLPSLYNGKETVVSRAKGIISNLDGLVFSGGGDIDPAFFEEEPFKETGQINAERDLFELGLARSALELNLPVLAICRGMQLLNIVAGGDIWQDIRLGFKNPLKHFQQAPKWYPTHSISIAKDSLLHKSVGTLQLRVNSFHHQVVRRVAPGFKVCARSMDGVIEGIESTRHNFVLGVQFHPEYLWQRGGEFSNLFCGFINASNAFREYYKK